MTKLLERDIQKQIRMGLEADGWLVWRNQTGGTLSSYKGKSRMVRFGAKGQGDLFALKNGVFLSVEVKRLGNVPTAEQFAWMVQVNEHGGIGVVAYDYGDVQRAIYVGGAQ